MDDGRDLRGQRGDEDEDRVELPPFLLDPLGVLQRRWVWMLPALLLGLLGTLIAVARMDPIYAATAKVLVQKQQIPTDFVRPTVVVDPLMSINTMVGHALSRNSLAELLERFELYASGSERAKPLVDRIGRMRGNIVIKPDLTQGVGESLVYDVTFLHTDREKAAEVANAVAALMIESSIETRGAQARRTTEFLKKSLAEDERRLEEASKLVSDFRREHRGTLPSELEPSLRKLDLLAQRRESINSRIASAENLISTMAATGRASDSQTLLEDLRKQLAQQTAAHTDEHPNVIALREQIARLEGVVGSEGGHGTDRTTQVRIASERRSIAHLHEQLQATDEEIAELDGRVDRIPKVAEELKILEQKEKALRDAHLASLRKVAEAELAESLETAEQGSRVTLLDSAQVPTSPERNRLKYLLAGALVSLLLAVGVGIGLELVDPVIVGVRQLEQVLGGPALGAMPRIGD